MHVGVSPVSVSRVIRLDALTSLRFFAAFAIVVEHSRGLFLSEHVLAAWPLDQAVSFFFILSGFVLFHVYPDLPNKQAIARFWLARVARIWPAHLGALVMLLLVAGNQMYRLLGTDSVLITSANLVLVQAWIPLRDFYFSLNAVSWSISTELAFYLLFPVLIFGFKSTWHWKLFGAAALLVALMLICTAWRLPGYSADYDGVTTNGVLYVNPLARLFEFVLGMCCGLWWHRVRPRLGGNVIVWTVAEVAAFAFALWWGRHGIATIYALIQSGPLRAGQEWAAHAAGCFGFAALILVMASGTGLIGRLLTFAPLIFLGEISYGIYLFHQVLIVGYSIHLGIMRPIPAALQWPAYLAVLLMVSTLSYFLLEQPLRAKIRSLGRRQIPQFQLAPAGDHSPGA
jgi:peptidoglycan/LPS O-acetylase OafA/YrhL